MSIKTSDFDHLKRQCQICRKIVIATNTIIIPSTTGLRVCYPCFTFWAEDYPSELLMEKMIKWWRNPKWEATGD